MLLNVSKFISNISIRAFGNKHWGSPQYKPRTTLMFQVLKKCHNLFISLPYVKVYVKIIKTEWV